jgi:hypothetical protein
MIRVLVKQGRGLLVVVALLAVAVAACSSGNPAKSGNNATGNNGTSQPGGGGSGLGSGLSGNLDKLDSYKFTWAIAGADASATSSSVGTISGTVINKPTKSSSVNDFGVLFVTIGTDQWMSPDNGTTWIVNSDPTSLDSMLPTSDYAAYFDAYATTYKQIGIEKKNGVNAVHFQGDLGSLSGLLGQFGGVANMKADLWIAQDGNYPVSGTFSYAFAVGTSGGSFSYSFDITNVNDAANKVEKPTNVTEIPS